MEPTGMTHHHGANHRHRVLVLTAKPGLSITDIRLGVPFASLRDEGFLIHRIKGMKDALLEDLLWADAVVLQREASPIALKWACATKQMGRWLIFELDDLLFSPASHLKHRKAILENGERLRTISALADIISVSTRRLQAALPTTARSKAHVTPNYATPPACPPATQSEANAEYPVTLVLASSDAMSLSQLLPALKAVQANPPAPLEILVVGAMAEPLQQQQLTVRTSPSLALNEFKALLCKQTNPIGLIPLDDSPFSACKSAIKHFDFSMCGIPSICSDLPPYSDVVTSGIDGLLVPDHEQAWRQAITALCTDVALRQRLAANAQHRVKQDHNLMTNTQAWREIIESLPRGRAPRRLTSPILDVALRLELGPIQRIKMGLRQLNEKRKQKR